MTKTIKGVIAALGAVLLWSTTYALVKIELNTTPPYTFALVRGVIALAILFIILYVQKQTKGLCEMLKKNFFLTLVLGATGYTLLQIFQNIGLTMTSSSLTSVLINTDPIFILLLAVFFLKEKTHTKKILGVLVGLLGIVIIVTNGEGLKDIITTKSFMGNILVLFASVSWSVYSVITKSASKKFSPIILTTVSFLIGVIFLIPFTIVLEPIKLLQPLNITYFLILFYLGIVSGVGGLLWNYSLSQIEVSRTAIFLYLIPVIGISIGVLLLKEQFTMFHLIGTVLVLLGIFTTEK